MEDLESLIQRKFNEIIESVETGLDEIDRATTESGRTGEILAQILDLLTMLRRDIEHIIEER